MGIRVHKFLGYGLTDIQTEDMKITDPRINAASWALTREGEPSPVEYQEWLAVHDSGRPAMDYGYLRHGFRPPSPAPGQAQAEKTATAFATFDGCGARMRVRDCPILSGRRQQMGLCDQCVRKARHSRHTDHCG